jgi:hypothetical protein
MVLFLKGTVSRDFRPPVFFINQPHLGHWSAGYNIFACGCEVAEKFAKMCWLRDLPHSVESQLGTKRHSAESQLCAMPHSAECFWHSAELKQNSFCLFRSRSSNSLSKYKLCITKQKNRIEFLRELDSIFKTTLAYKSGDPGVLLNEKKTECRKSCETVHYTYTLKDKKSI